VAIFCYVFFYGCQKDDSFSEVIIENSQFSIPKIEDVKSNYLSKRGYGGAADNLAFRGNTNTLNIDWDNSNPKRYKDEVLPNNTLQGLDILYTPIHLNTLGHAKAFIGSVNNNGNVESKIYVLFYTNSDIPTKFSGYIMLYSIEGQLENAYNYQEGIQIDVASNNSQNIPNTANRASDPGCDIFETIGCMLDFLGDDWFGVDGFLTQDEVIVNAIVYSTLGNRGIEWHSPDINIPAESNGGQSSSGGNTTGQWWSPVSVTPNLSAITAILGLPINSITYNWLQNQNNQDLLDAIAQYLNANRIQNINDPTGNSGEHTSNTSTGPHISQQAIDTVLDYISNKIDNPLLGADCRSFEYAQPPGALKKGCAVTDFNHTFYAFGINSQGFPYWGDIDSTIPIIYFTMPNWMTNGQAANVTAVAVTNAIRATDLYFWANAYDSEYEVGDFFKDALRSQLALVGGSVSTTNEPFPIPSPAPYLTSLFGASTDCN
jgi:hypothetical protein